MKALKKGARRLRKGDSKVTVGRKIDVRKVSKRGFWIALNSLTGEEIFQKIRLSPGGVCHQTSTLMLYYKQFKIMQ